MSSWNATVSSWSKTQATTPAPTSVPGYDRTKFVVRASDDRGHSRTITLRLDPAIFARLQAFAHDEQFPDYQSPNDVIRDALYHLFGMRLEQVTDPDFREALEQQMHEMRLQHTIAALTYNSEQYGHLIETTRAAMSRLDRDGAFDQVLHHCDLLELQAEEVAPPYDQHLRNFIAEWRGNMEERRKSGAPKGRKRVKPSTNIEGAETA